MKIRNLTLPQIWARARQDGRNLPYDLLPLSGGPRRRGRLARAAAALRPGARDLEGGDARAAALDAQLRDRGYTDRLDLLDPGQVAAMRRFLEGTRCHDPYRPHLGDFLWDAVPSEETNMGYYRVEDLLAVPGLLEFFNHPLILATAARFLGCRPTLDNMGGWWSIAGRGQSKGTQWFHRDWDNIRAFKVFLYLTDVDGEAGPFQFVPRSNRDERLVVITRIADSEVEAAYGPGAAVSMSGPAGTVFMADTFGIHKGLLPRGRPRLMVTAQYGVWRTPHSPRVPPLPARPGLDAYVNRAYLARP